MPRCGDRPDWRAGAREQAEYASDQINLKRILDLRQHQAQVFFNQVAGRFDRSYGPGRSWQGLGQLLLRILPPLTVADLGSGEGLVAELLARRCKRVIAVDNSEKIVEFGAAKAAKAGLRNLEFRLGDLQDPPIDAASVDVVILEPGAPSRRPTRPGHPQRPPDSASEGPDPDSRSAPPSVQTGPGSLWRRLARLRRKRHAALRLEAAGFRKIELSLVARRSSPALRDAPGRREWRESEPMRAVPP